MSEVTITRVERLFLLFSKRRSGQTVVGLEELPIGAMARRSMFKPTSSQKKKMPELTITAIARLARVSPSTLRYYEKIGILPPARRVGGRRRYDLSTLKQLEFITYTKQAGFSLRQIQGLQEGASRGKAPARLWRDLVVEKAGELDQILFRVHRAQRHLATLARCRCRNLAECVDLLATK